MKIFSIAFVAVWPTLLLAADSRNLDLSKDIVFENDKVRFRFEHGNMGLVEMTDLVSHFQHVRKDAGPGSLWSLTFGTGTQRRIVTNTNAPCSRATLETLANATQRLTLEWNEVTWYKEPGALSVRATVDLKPGDGVAIWRITVTNSSDTWGLWSIAYPKASNLLAGGQYDIARPYFAVGGILLPKWNEAVLGEYPSGGWSMQVASLTKEANSIYLAAYDPDGWRKDFAIDPAAGVTQILHYPEGMALPGNNFLDPYPVAFGTYQGDWRDAAVRYRDWALQQKWASAGPIAQRPSWSKRLADIGYWVVYDFPLNDPENVPVEKLSDLLESARKRLGTDIGLHWYRWHQVPFDNHYPEFLPAKPGFAQMAQDLTKRGFLVMPYINGVSVDRSAKTFPKYLPGAAKDQAGGLYHKYYLDSSGRLLSMCGRDSTWRKTVSGLVQELVMNHNVNGVYIDQISAMPPELCFDSTHHHAPGGGAYGTNGYREILKAVQSFARSSGRDITITSESANEVFLDLLDANLTWGTATGFEIPFFETVYSGYTTSFGSVTPLNRSEQFFRRIQGSALLDGRQLGWLGPEIFQPKHEAKVAYLQKALAFRKSALPYLLYGQLQQVIAPRNSVPSFEAETELMDRKQVAKFPGAEGRIWRSQDGRIGIIFANFLEQKIDFSWEFAGASFGLKPGQYRIRENGTEKAIHLPTTIRRTETLGPLEFKLIELLP